MRKFYLASFVTLPEEIIEFRNKYDSKAQLIPPHATLVFPFSFDEIDQLENHIKSIVENYPTFDFNSETFSVSFDNYIFLDFQMGKDNIQRLHDTLYTGMLTPFLRKDIPFMPHITIGNCNDSNKGEIINELQLIYKPFKGRVESITLAEITNDHEMRKIIREFKLI